MNDPCYWRERAKETRMMADKLTDPLARDNMLKVAAAYDRMADRAETDPNRMPFKSDSAA